MRLRRPARRFCGLWGEEGRGEEEAVGVVVRGTQDMTSMRVQATSKSFSICVVKRG